MGRFVTIQNSFVAGEVSPKVYGRTDMPQYKHAAKEIKNFIVTPQGGVTRRPGSQYVLSPSPFATKLIPFIFSRSEAYAVVLLSGSTAMNIVSVDTGTSINKSFVDTTVTNFVGNLIDTGFASLTAPKEEQFTQVADLLVVTHYSHFPVFILRLNGSFATTSFDTRAWYCGSFQKVRSDSMWNAFPYRDKNVDPELGVTASGTSGSPIILTATNSTPANVGLFHGDMKGTPWKFTDGTNTWSLVITGTAGTQREYGSNSASSTSGYYDQATAEILTGTLDDLDAVTSTMPGASTSRTTQWYESAWSKHRGWPRSCVFYKDRLLMLGNASEPDKVWCSQTGDFRRFNQLRFAQDGTTGLESDAVSFTLNSGTLDEIQWAIVSKNLIIGTASKEWIVAGDIIATDQPVAVVSPDGASGSVYTQAVRLSTGCAFINAKGQYLKELVFTDAENAFKDENLSILAEHMSKKGLSERTSPSSAQILQICKQDHPHQMVWCVDANGMLFSVTRERDQSVIAWHNHRLGGVAGSDTPVVQSACVLPSILTTNDDLWLLVTRSINSSVVTYIEKIGQEFEAQDLYNTFTDISYKPVFSDSAKLVIAPDGISNAVSGGQNIGPRKAFSGFDHLKGEEVVIVGDGAYLGTKTVQNGTTIISNGNAEVNNTTGWNDFVGGTEVISGPSDATFIDTVNDKITAANTLKTNQQISYSAGTSDIGGLVDSSGYFVVNPTPTSFQLSEYPDGDPIDLTSYGSGIHDFTAGLPTNISGGIPTTTFTNTSVTPISGSRSFLFTKGLTTTDRDGVYYDLTIPEEDAGHEFTVSFSYINTAGYSGPYLYISVFDVDNDKWCLVDGLSAYLFSSSTSSTSDSFKFITNLNGTTYRLFLYDKSGNAVSYEMRIDNISIVKTGSILLDHAVNEVIVGLNYQSRVETLQLEAGQSSSADSAQGSIKRIDKATIRFSRTVGAKYGRSDAKLEEIPFRPSDLAQNDEIPMFTGDKVLTFNAESDRDARIVVVQDLPLPCTVSSVILRGTTND